MRNLLRIVFILSFVVLLGLAATVGEVAAGEPFPAREQNAQTTLAFWTPEKLASARPLPFPRVPIGRFVEAQEDLAVQPTPLAPRGFGACPPRVAVEPEPDNVLYVPMDSALEVIGESSLEHVGEPDFGTGKAHYSSSRLVPLTADLAYPYSTVGRLFFEVPGAGPAVCSAAVIASRLVLTAGHCVHSGSANPGAYTNHLFVPALRDGAAPLGAWPATVVMVTPTWTNGRGRVPNASDFAVLEVEDRSIQGSVRRLGEVVGSLGLLTRSLFPNHVHMLGYPSAFDNGQKIHQVTSASLRHDRKGNVVLYGSDLTEGASGGPWIQNFGAAAEGQVEGANGALNHIVGVSSFKIASTRVVGSSIPDSRVLAMVTALCARRAGNCG